MNFLIQNQTYFNYNTLNNWIDIYNPYVLMINALIQQTNQYQDQLFFDRKELWEVKMMLFQV